MSPKPITVKYRPKYQRISFR